MNLLKNIVISTIALTSVGALAQAQDVNNYDFYSTTVEKTIPYEKDGEIIPVKMKIVETRKYSFEFEAADLGEIDKDLVETPVMVTKEIYVDNDKDDSYDKFIVMSYEKSANDTFEIIPTNDSIAIKLDNSIIKPVTSEGYIVANTKDADIVMIETYASL